MNLQRIAVLGGIGIGASTTAAFAALTARSLFCDAPGRAAPGHTGSTQGPEGFSDTWISHVPGPVRGPMLWFRGAADQAARAIHELTGLGPDRPSPIGSPKGPIERAAANPTTARERATTTWQSIERGYAVGGEGGVFHNFLSSPHMTASSWSHGQIVAAALDLAQVTGDWTAANDALRVLSHYEVNGSYTPGVFQMPKFSTRLWDDNAWIMLDFLQAHAMSGDQSYVEAAEKMVPFMRAGMTPEGGMRWIENADSVHTCSVAPSEQAFLRLYMATGKQEYLDDARRLEHYRTTGPLARDDGMYSDNVSADGRVDQMLWSYNQGTPIGADVLWYQLTGDSAYLDRAKKTAAAALKHFGRGDVMWSGQPPAFNAIFFRNLLALDAWAPDPSYRVALDGYLNRAWNEGRDSVTGLFDQGGIAAYGTNEGDPPNIIDQAGLAQLYALQAWSREDLKTLVA